MDNFIIIAIIIVLGAFGVRSMVKHFKHESACCGGGSNYVSKKKLKNVVAKKSFVVEGMSCENCKARVERFLNDLDGVVAKVNLKKKEVCVSMEREVSDEEIVATIEKAGYTVK